MSAILTEASTEPVGDPERASAATWYAFRRNPMGLVATAILLLLLLVALCAPLIAPYPSGFGADVLQPPSSAHWFGTDNLGRDVFAEVVWGTRHLDDRRHRGVAARHHHRRRSSGCSARTSPRLTPPWP